VSEKSLKKAEPIAVDNKLKMMDVKIKVLMFLNGQTNIFL